MKKLTAIAGFESLRYERSSMKVYALNEVKGFLAEYLHEKKNL
ncbi:MAG TPA: hypothetical protein VJ208_00305 [Candidatus Nanoarchaeia archaeon]|nr:hypothetical protein [Candidatus Nanoarchaeia archaeon]